MATTCCAAALAFALALAFAFAFGAGFGTASFGAMLSIERVSDSGYLQKLEPIL